MMKKNRGAGVGRGFKPLRDQFQLNPSALTWPTKIALR